MHRTVLHRSGLPMTRGNQQLFCSPPSGQKNSLLAEKGMHGKDIADSKKCTLDFLVRCGLGARSGVGPRHRPQIQISPGTMFTSLVSGRWEDHVSSITASKRFALIFFPLLVLKGIYPYWICFFTFSGGLKQMEVMFGLHAFKGSKLRKFA